MGPHRASYAVDWIAAIGLGNEWFVPVWDELNGPCGEHMPGGSARGLGLPLVARFQGRCGCLNDFRTGECFPF